jgi:hypothetical protein
MVAWRGDRVRWTLRFRQDEKAPPSQHPQDPPPSSSVSVLRVACEAIPGTGLGPRAWELQSPSNKVLSRGYREASNHGLEAPCGF